MTDTAKTTPTNSHTVIVHYLNSHHGMISAGDWKVRPVIETFQNVTGTSIRTGEGNTHWLEITQLDRLTVRKIRLESIESYDEIKTMRLV